MIETVLAALSALSGTASALNGAATQAPGTAGNRMNFGSEGQSIDETFKREQKTPWMQAVGNQSATSPTGFGIQQPVDQSITMQEMFG